MDEQNAMHGSGHARNWPGVFALCLLYVCSTRPYGLAAFWPHSLFVRRIKSVTAPIVRLSRFIAEKLVRFMFARLSGHCVLRFNDGRNHGLRGHNHGGRVRRKPVGFVSVERWQVYARWRMAARPDCEA